MKKLINKNIPEHWQCGKATPEDYSIYSIKWWPHLIENIRFGFDCECQQGQQFGAYTCPKLTQALKSSGGGI